MSPALESAVLLLEQVVDCGLQRISVEHAEVFGEDAPDRLQ